MKIDKPPLKTGFFGVAGIISHAWEMWFNSITERFQKMFTINDEIKAKVYEQDSEPALTENKSFAIWIDTNDSNRAYIIYRRGDSDHVKTELT